MTRSRVCHGPTHDQPTLLPETPEYWYYHKSGRSQGKPLTPCRACSNWPKLIRKDGPHGYVPYTEVLPWLTELVWRCGGIRPAERASGIPSSTLQKLLGNQNRRVLKITATRILGALVEQRKLDRQRGTTSVAYLAARRRVARTEGQLAQAHGL